ncbi:MAG: DUF262 domain-containing protein [Devosia sp.]
MEKQISFAQLMEKNRVLIPAIQRDYAQGREGQEVIRDEFLGSIHEALLRPVGDPALPLDLDFVYGSNVNGTFQPLDGQQRLTTLFLLHWLLASKAGKLDDFRARFVAGQKSRFSYKVRPSSEEFIDSLSVFEPGVISGTLSGLIKDQPWYKLSWQFDQTIRSALQMLDAMDKQFADVGDLYGRLVDADNRVITFQLLDLGQYNLSDELYIKMNARGKPLTPFETFKARFVQHLRTHMSDLGLPICAGRPVHEVVAERMDQQWSDFFWSHHDPATATFDTAIMNLVRLLILVTRDPDGDATAEDLRLLMARDVQPGYAMFTARGWLDRPFVTALVCLLERWSRDHTKQLRTYLPADCPFDLNRVFRLIMTDSLALTNLDVVLFAAYVQFITAAHGEIDEIALGNWMRVVFNLAANYDYNRTADIQRSFGGLQRMASWMDDINAHLTRDDAAIPGFFPHQLEEERLKAHLIRIGDGWPKRIRDAEEHKYFRGQIGFLLHFAGFDLADLEGNRTNLDAAIAHQAVQSFEHYFACADQMISDLRDRSKAEGRIWERAALAQGDILMQSWHNQILPGMAAGAGSWKRLMAQGAANDPCGMVLKQLWDRVADPRNAQATLVDIIKTELVAEDWRRAIVDTPEIYDYCEQRMLRFETWNGGRYYPLVRSQMNGRHAELFTYCLNAQLKRTGELKALNAIAYWETNSSEEPQMQLVTTIGATEHEFLVQSTKSDGMYWLWLHGTEPLEKPMTVALASQGFTWDGEFWVRTIDRGTLRTAVLGLDTAILALGGVQDA